MIVFPLGWVILGAILGLILISVARRRQNAALRIYAIGLAVAALLYVAFAVFLAAPVSWVGLELFGLLLYGSVAFTGFHHHPGALALGWATHAVWDVSLHLHGTGALYAPDWYAPLCAGFDLVVAVAILSTARPRAVD